MRGKPRIFYLFSSTRLIKHEHSCKILYGKVINSICLDRYPGGGGGGLMSSTWAEVQNCQITEL